MPAKTLYLVRKRRVARCGYILVCQVEGQALNVYVVFAVELKLTLFGHFSLRPIFPRAAITLSMGHMVQGLTTS